MKNNFETYYQTANKMTTEKILREIGSIESSETLGGKERREKIFLLEKILKNRNIKYRLERDDSSWQYRINAVVDKGAEKSSEIQNTIKGKISLTLKK